MCYPIIIRKQEFPVTIREKRTPISQFAAALRQRSPQEKRDLLVADTLDSLCRHCDLYDAARVSSNPFHPELLRTIAAADLSSEALFFIAVRCPDDSSQHKKRPAGAGLFLQDHSSRYRTRLIR